MTMRMRVAGTLLAAILLAACAGGGEGGSGGDGGADEVSLTLNWIPYGEHAPFYYGLKQGFYREEGIDLTIRPGSGSARTIEQVAGRKTDIGWADTPPLLLGVQAGMPVKSIGVFLQKGPASIEFFADKGIRTPKDLVGKTVAATPGDAMYATFPGWLQANGISKDDVKVVNVDAAGKISVLIEGRADAILGFFHDQGPTIEHQTGREVSALLYADWGMNLLGTGLVVHEATIKERADLLKRFMRATVRSWKAAAEQPEAAAAAMAEQAEQEPPQEVLVEQLRQTIPLVQVDGREPGANTREAWQQTIDLLAGVGKLRDPEQPEEYWDPSFAAGGQS